MGTFNHRGKILAMTILKMCKNNTIIYSLNRHNFTIPSSAQLANRPGTCGFHRTQLTSCSWALSMPWINSKFFSFVVEIISLKSLILLSPDAVAIKPVKRHLQKISVTKVDSRGLNWKFLTNRQNILVSCDTRIRYNNIAIFLWLGDIVPKLSTSNRHCLSPATNRQHWNTRTKS